MKADERQAWRNGGARSAREAQWQGDPNTITPRANKYRRTLNGHIEAGHPVTETLYVQRAPQNVSPSAGTPSPTPGGHRTPNRFTRNHNPNPTRHTNAGFTGGGNVGVEVNLNANVKVGGSSHDTLNHAF